MIMIILINDINNYTTYIPLKTFFFASQAAQGCLPPPLHRQTEREKRKQVGLKALQTFAKSRSCNTNNDNFDMAYRNIICSLCVVASLMLVACIVV